MAHFLTCKTLLKCQLLSGPSSASVIEICTPFPAPPLYLALSSSPRTYNLLTAPQFT